MRGNELEREYRDKLSAVQEGISRPVGNDGTRLLGQPYSSAMGLMVSGIGKFGKLINFLCGK